MSENSLIKKNNYSRFTKKVYDGEGQCFNDKFRVLHLKFKFVESPDKFLITLGWIKHTSTGNYLFERVTYMNIVKFFQFVDTFFK